MDPTLMEDNVSEINDENLVLVRITIPDIAIQKCMQFHQEELIWDVKQQILAMITKDLKESFNYGLYCPPLNGRAGKFLDDERPLMDYPFPGPIGNLELKYKKRVYKMINVDAKQIRQLHTKANFRRILEYVNTGQAEKISKLCSKGMDPNFHCPENGETPLTLAVAQKSCKKTILALANGGAHLDFRTRDGVTALHRAVEKNSMEAIKTLLDLGASPNYKDSKGSTPLYYSVLYPTDAHICELLLHDHATIGASDNKQWQETHQACRNGLVQHLEHLLFYGADLNARNASGNTPLHVCAANEQEGCARVLLFRGAHKEALNYANQTPYQVAVIAGSLELAEVIKNHQPEDVVHFREAPTYNPRRRASTALNRARSDPRLEITLGLKPPSPSPSNRSLPPFSCASSLSETSTGSSTCTQHSNEDSSGDTASISAVTERSITSDSSGICVSSSGGYNTLCIERSTPMLMPLTPGLACVCVENYLPIEDGHLQLAQGDIVEITGSTDDGYLEGICHGQQGLFSASCVQEVWLRKRVEGRREFGVKPSPPPSVPVKSVVESKRYFGETRTAVLHKGKKGFGFVLRGAKSTSPLMEIQPSDKFPALQYLDDVDIGGPADLAGLAKGDFLVAINGEDVSHVSHEYVVNVIRKSGNTVTMTVVSCPPYIDLTQPVQTLKSTRHFSTLPRKISRNKAVPVPPRRDPSTTLSVGRYRARSMVAGLAEIEALDRVVAEYDDENMSFLRFHESANSTLPPTISGLPPKSASVQSRLQMNGSRTTAAEIEELFFHQKELREGEKELVNGNGTLKSPKVYGSVAEMKRSRTKGPKLERLHKVFRSTPDLKECSNNINGLSSVDDQTSASNAVYKRSQEDVTVIRLNGMNLHKSNKSADGMWRSIDDIYNSVEERKRLCSTPPAPTHPPPPPPISQVVRVDIFNSKGDYAKVINVAGEALKNSGVMSSFRPGDSAKLYASPVELGIVGYASSSTAIPTYKPMSVVQSRTLQPPVNYTNHNNANSLSSNNSSEAETSGDSTGYYGPHFTKTSGYLQTGLGAPDTISTDSGNSSERGSSIGFATNNPNPYAQPMVVSVDPKLIQPVTCIMNHEKIEENGEVVSRKTPYIPEPDYDICEEDEINLIATNHIPPPPPPPPPILSPCSPTEDLLLKPPPKLESLAMTLKEVTLKKAEVTNESRASKLGVDSTKIDLMNDLKHLIAQKAAERQRRSTVLDVLVEAPENKENNGGDVSDVCKVTSLSVREQVSSLEKVNSSSVPTHKVVDCAAQLSEIRKDSNVQILQIKMEEKIHSSHALLNENSAKAQKSSNSQRKAATHSLENELVTTLGIDEKIEESMKLIEMHANSLQEVNALVGLASPPPPPPLPSTPVIQFTTPTSKQEIAEVGGLEMIAPPPEFSDETEATSSLVSSKKVDELSTSVGDDVQTASSPTDKNSSKLPVRSRFSPQSQGSFSNGRMTAFRGGKSGSNRSASSASGVKQRLSSTGTLKTIDMSHVGVVPGQSQHVNKVKVNVAPITQVNTNCSKEFQSKPVIQWTVGDVSDWLDSLYLTEYKARFEAARVDGNRLSCLGSGGLTDLGVKRIGHRMNIERSLRKHSMMKQ